MTRKASTGTQVEDRARATRQSRWARTKLIQRRSGLALGAALIAAAGLVVLPLSMSASAQPAQTTPPTVTLGPVGTAESTGVVVTATVNPEGSDTFYSVVYGPAGGALSQQTGWQDAGSGTTPENLSIVADQLAPSTTYDYQVALFSNALGQQFNSTTGTITTAALPTGPAAPSIPPDNPPDGIFGFCASDAACVNDMNGDRAALENLAPLALPSNWSTLTGAEQIFVWTNLERTSRGEAAIPNLVNTYDADVQTGVTNDKDPSLDPLPGAAGSIWAGAFPTTLGAMYGWLYDDGPGGANRECTATNTAGCWGHRDNILSDPARSGANPDEMDAVAGLDSAGQKGYAAAFASNPNPTPAANIVLSWASEQPFLAGAGAPPAPTVNPDHVSGRVCTNCTPPLTYQGGAVAGTATTSGGATVTEVFWDGSGAFPFSYRGELRRYIIDLSDSGPTDVFSVDSEYSQTVNGQPVPIQNPIVKGPAANDTDPFPANGCTPDPGYTACITDAQIQAELTTYLASRGLPEDLAHIYPVLLPPGVETVDSTGAATVTSASDYCGYHNDFASPTGGVVLYTDEPYPPLNGCGTGQAPNGDAEADSAVSILSVELNEAVTDPTGAGWVDGAGNEIGDECDSTFGIPLGSTDAANPGTTLYNQVINGQKYYTQEEFSNAEAAAVGPSHGCVQDESQVTAAAGATVASVNSPSLTPAGTPTLNTVTVQTSDSTVSRGARATVTVEVTGANGAPVGGDPITLDVTATAPTTSVCGTLSAQHGVTASDGKWSAIYTASKANLPCAVLAIEADTGQSAQAAIGQGTVATYSPVVKVRAPSRAVLGRVVTVHAMVTNPGDAINSTVIEVSLTSPARKGLAARLVHLSYLSHGRWVKVPLKGSTSRGSVMAGSLTGLPVTLAGHASERITLRLTVEGPASAFALRSPLSLKVALNQVNRANRSADLLGYKVVTLHLVRKA
jgi:hypothetical protein